MSLTFVRFHMMIATSVTLWHWIACPSITWSVADQLCQVQFLIFT